MTIKKLCYFILLCTFSISNANADVFGVAGWINDTSHDINNRLIKPITHEISRMTNPINLLCAGINKSDCKKALGVIGDNIDKAARTEGGQIIAALLQDMPVCVLKHLTSKASGNKQSECNVRKMKWLNQDDRDKLPGNQGKLSKQDVTLIKKNLLKHVKATSECETTLVKSWISVIERGVVHCNFETRGRIWLPKQLYQACAQSGVGAFAWPVCLGGYVQWFDLVKKEGMCRKHAKFDLIMAKKLATAACGGVAWSGTVDLMLFKRNRELMANHQTKIPCAFNCE